MESSKFYILLLTICLVAISGYFFVSRVLWRFFGKFIRFIAKGALIAILLLATAFFGPKFIQGNFQEKPSESCRHNCDKICSALNYYAQKNKHFPSKLIKLTPKYLKTIPTCPLVKKDTYSKGYYVSKDYRRFTLYCTDKKHDNLIFRDNL